MGEKEREISTQDRWYSPLSHLKVDEIPDMMGEMEPEASSPDVDLYFPPFQMRTPDKMGEMEPEASTPDENSPPSHQWMDKTPDNSPVIMTPFSRIISAKTLRRLNFQRMQNKWKKSAKVLGKRKGKTGRQKWKEHKAL